MNTEALNRYLKNYSKWFAANRSIATQERNEREQLALKVQSFTRERLEQMDEEDLFDCIAPLWAMTMWGNRHYQVDNIIQANGMSLLRDQFSNLIYGSESVEKRWDTFRSKVKGIGPAIMSELLCKAWPDQYLLWNRRTYDAFRLLRVPKLPRYEAKLTGKTYEYLSGQGREMVVFAKQNGCSEITNMLTLNSFFWQELKNKNNPEPIETDEDLSPKGKKEALFVHNDIRDKLADIGRFLGFRAEVEKK